MILHASCGGWVLPLAVRASPIALCCTRPPFAGDGTLNFFPVRCTKPSPPRAGSGAFPNTSRTKQILETLPSEAGEVGGAGAAGTYRSLQQRDGDWYRLRHQGTGEAAGPPPQFVVCHPGRRWVDSLGLDRDKDRDGDRDSDQGVAASTAVVAEGTYDVAVCGGTLGIFVAAALANAGKRVVVVERGKVQGRTQEWNVSRTELQELQKMGLLRDEDLQDVIAVEFNPNRCGFKGGKDVLVSGILNLGVSPKKLVEKIKQKFILSGGTILEGSALEHISVFDDGVLLSIAGRRPLSARLLVDAMGNFSPIVRQIRWGQRPDGVCLVVGSCARGFPEGKNRSSDVLFTDSDITTVAGSRCQLFWEAFPAGSGPTDRTTYLFTYVDAQPERPSLEQLMDEYWNRMPLYQGVCLDDLQLLRVLFGFFPAYRDSPLKTPFDRIIQVGDASGIQSPLSFGGFGSITRHLGRISGALLDALDWDLLSKEHLGLINAYQPNLSTAWLLQRAMSPPIAGSPVPADFINSLLSANFAAMQGLGDPVMRPFLQDVVQFRPLALTMGAMVLSSPQLLPDIFRLVGLLSLLDWLSHFAALGAYTGAAQVLDPFLRSFFERLDKGDKFWWKRQLESWEFGAGLDYKGKP